MYPCTVIPSLEPWGEPNDITVLVEQRLLGHTVFILECRDELPDVQGHPNGITVHKGWWL